MSRKPQFIRDREHLEEWLENYNPLRGLTLQKLGTLLDEVDQGQFSNVMWLSRKMERRDEHVRACKKRLSAELSRMDWDIKITETLPAGMTEKQAEAQRQALEERYNQIENLKAAYQFLALAELRQYSHLEIHYGPEGQPVRLEPVPQWHWVRDGIYGVWRYNPTARPWPNINALTAIDDKERQHWIIREVEDPWLDIALIAGLRKNLGRRDWDGFLSGYGIPPFFFEAPPGSTDEKIAQFQEVADEMASDGRGVLPNGSKVHTVDVGGQRGEVFASYQRDAGEAIVLAATGGLLTMLTASGSGTLAGEAHLKTWLAHVSGVADEVAETFQEQFDKPFLAERFPGQPIAAYFVLEHPTLKQDRSKVIEDVAKLKSAGYKVPIDEVEEMTGLELEEVDAASEPGDKGKKKKVEDEEPELDATRRDERNPVRNREPGDSERDRLYQNAVAELLEVVPEYLAPIDQQIQRLIALVESETATAADFEQLAREIEDSFPELLEEMPVDQLTQAFESAMGTAMALGVRDQIRRMPPGQ